MDGVSKVTRQKAKQGLSKPDLIAGRLIETDLILCKIFAIKIKQRHHRQQHPIHNRLP